MIESVRVRVRACCDNYDRLLKILVVTLCPPPTIYLSIYLSIYVSHSTTGPAESILYSQGVYTDFAKEYVRAETASIIMLL